VLPDEVSNPQHKLLNRIGVLTQQFPEGRNATLIPFLTVVRLSQPTTFAPAVLTPSFCLIVQGKKRIHIGQEIIDYGAGDFVASVIDTPAAGQVVEATKHQPYIGLRINLATQEIASVITEAKIHIEPQAKKSGAAAFVGRAGTPLLELFAKLIQLLGKPKEAIFMAGLVKREMIFRLLTGEHAHLFLQKAIFGQTADGVGRVIEWIRRNYSTTISVDELARSNGMSVSGLHHKFKAITTRGPLQYQKELRLQEARRLMLSGSMDVTRAALEVGYQSASQFNREYRRLFGLPPSKDIRSILGGSNPIAHSE
jgi:AraC-like DNA-binding protein